MKHTSYFLILFCLAFFNATMAKTPPELIVGKWISNKGNFIVEVYKTGNKYHAKLVWFDDTDTDLNTETATDNNNPNSELRSRKLIGMEVLENLTYNTNSNKYEEGTIYDATTGKKWTAFAFLDEQKLLVVKAYWQFKFISQTLVLKRYCLNQNQLSTNNRVNPVKKY